MYAYLGNIAFENSMGIEGFSSESSISLSEQSRIQNKPILQVTGINLDTSNIDMTFHKFFCNPAEKIRQLNEILKESNPQTLVFANGTYKGKFILEKINSTLKRTDAKGNIISATLNVSLKEYANDGVDNKNLPSDVKPMIETGFPKKFPFQDEAIESTRDYLKNKSSFVVQDTIARNNIDTDFIEGIQSGYKMTASA